MHLMTESSFSSLSAIIHDITQKRLDSQMWHVERLCDVVESSLTYS